VKCPEATLQRREAVKIVPEIAELLEAGEKVNHTGHRSSKQRKKTLNHVGIKRNWEK